MGRVFPQTGYQSLFGVDFKQTATKFEIAGTSNYPGAVGLGASLAQINEMGINNIHRHILDLGLQLRSGLESLGARVVSPGDPEESAQESPSSTSSNLRTRIMRFWRHFSRKIYLAQRYTSGIGGIRASTHFYNNEEDVDELLCAIEELKA